MNTPTSKFICEYKYLEAPMTCLRPCHPKTVVSPLGVFFSCVFPSLFVLVRLFVAFLFPSVVWLVWRCLVVVVLGCCVLLCGLFLALSSGAVLLPVLVLLPLPSLSRVWLAAWCGFAPGCGVPSVAYVGFSFPCLARLLVAPGRPLAFPRLCLFLSLCSFLIVSYLNDIYHFFLIFLFSFFVLAK